MSSRTILVVDDDASVLSVLDRALRAAGFNTVAVSDPDRARELLDLLPVDAIVADLAMPMKNGHVFAASAAGAAREVPIVIVTGHHDLTHIVAMLEGTFPRAVLPKPVDNKTLVETLSKILSSVVLRHQDGDVELTRELAQSMARALALRDVETEAHARRVAMWGRHLATAMGLAEVEVFWIEIGALLHDIGKIGIPDAILKKPGPLDEEEWKVMQLHSELGASLIEPVRRLRRAHDLVLHHHESWDGSGYPRGLAGESIPLEARIFTPIDAYDAMTCHRPYRPGMSHDTAVSRLEESAGSQFDPAVVHVLLAIDPVEWRSVRLAVDGQMASERPPPSPATE